MQLSSVLILTWTPERSLSSPLMVQSENLEKIERWGAADDFPVSADQSSTGNTLFISTDQHSLNCVRRAKRVSDQDQTRAAAVNETQYVVRSEEMLVDHVGLPKPHTVLWTCRHKHLPSALLIYWRPFKLGRRQDISSTRTSLITAVSDCAHLKLLGNCVHFSYLCESNLPWGTNTSVWAGLIICLCYQTEVRQIGLDTVPLLEE